jgi:hypothetical protein
MTAGILTVTLVVLLSRAFALGNHLPAAAAESNVQERPAAVYLETVQQIMDASRGNGDYADLPPETVFVVRNGEYETPPGTKVLMWIRQGGSPDQRRRFIGESRQGVIISGRCTVEADYVDVENMTFSLADFDVDPKTSFSTVTVVNARHVRLADLDCRGTGDKGKRGGHIELMYLSEEKIAEDVLIENCLVERFGRQQHPEGKLDHGIYISAGRNVTIRHCEIRDNAGRGIQIFAHEGSWRRIHNVLIESNCIHDNGRSPYADGIVISTEPDAPWHSITDITIRNNIIYANANAGIRLSSRATGNILIENNTFWHSGGDTGWGVEFEVDRDGGGNDAVLRRNIFVPQHSAALGLGYGDNLSFEDNVVEGRPGELPVGRTYRNLLNDPENGDFSVRDPAFSNYGAQ